MSTLLELTTAYSPHTLRRKRGNRPPRGAAYRRLFDCEVTKIFTTAPRFGPKTVDAPPTLAAWAAGSYRKEFKRSRTFTCRLPGTAHPVKVEGRIV